MAKNPKILSIVLAGGEGTRLMPLTRDRAKPAVPFGGVRGRILARRQHRPGLRQFGIERHEGFLPGWDVFFRIDRVDRAFRLAEGAVDALVRIDHQEIRTFVETVHRAHLDAVGVLALDAVLGDDEGHGRVP